VVVRALVVWVLLAVVAVANGVARNFLLEPRIGEAIAHVAGTIVLCALIFLVTLATVGWIGPTRPLEASLIGLLWVVLTLSFEFLAGHFLFGHPWERLLGDYNISRGRFWILVPVVTYLAPRLALRMRGIWSR